MKEMIKKYDFKFDIPTITIIMYALYAIKCVWLAFASLDYSPVFYYIMQIPLALSLIFGLLTLFTGETEMPEHRILIILPCIYFLYSMIRSKNDDGYYTQVVFTTVIVLLFCIFKKEMKVQIFEMFYWIIQICNIPSLIFLLLYILNINLGFETVDYYSEIMQASYVKWGIFAIYKSSNELRLCGIFNEPGALGTVCSLLFAARFSNSKKWEKILLVITIIFTFSLAGYLILIIYLSLYLLKKNVRYAAVLALGLVLFLIIPKIDWHNEQLNQFLGRFEITENGLAGDNRTNEMFDLYYNQFRKSEDYFFGLNYEAMPKFNAIGSYKSYVLCYGIIGFSFWIFMWIISAFKYSKSDKDCLLFLFCFVISLYQRFPLIYSIYGYVLLFGGIEWIRSEKLMKTENNVKDSIT